MSERESTTKNTSAGFASLAEAAISNSLSSAFGQNFLTADGENVDAAAQRFRTIDLLFSLFDVLKPGSIVPVPRQLINLATISNRTVSFVLDGHTHIATGILVGPSTVLTAAHVFFDQEEQKLIERNWYGRLTVEARTTFYGNIVVEGPRVSSKLSESDPRAWLVDPKVDGNGLADREVEDLDFAIIKLEKPLGNNEIGSGIKREWFEIPTVKAAPILPPYLQLRVLQFLDREALLGSSGFVLRLDERPSRILHTASTADSASGSPIVDDEFRLLGIHVGGAASGERPKANRGLPISRVAESIDQPRGGRSTVRSQLKQ